MKTPELDRIAWIDLETTGLDERSCHVLELALVVTGWNLDVLVEASWVLAVDDAVSEFIWGMHGPKGSGLLALCAAEEAVPRAEAERQALALLAEFAGERPLLGGRNAHFDRRFLRTRLPRLHDALSHRSLDLTTLWLAFDRWVGPEEKGLQHHRALSDLERDIGETRRYRDQLARLREPHVPVSSLPTCTNWQAPTWQEGCDATATHWRVTDSGAVFACPKHGGRGFEPVPWAEHLPEEAP